MATAIEGAAMTVVGAGQVRGINRDPTLRNGLRMSPPLLRRASALLDQQMWCWGRDVRHDDGDALVRYGFYRWRTPPGLAGSHAYTLESRSGRRLTIWAFGLCLGDGRDGSVFLKRYDFSPQWRSEAELPTLAWIPTGLPRFCQPGDEHQPQVRRLTSSALELISAYEEWAIETLGLGYRQECVASWPKTRISAKRIVPSWRVLARWILGKDGSGCNEARIWGQRLERRQTVLPQASDQKVSGIGGSNARLF